MTTATLPSSFPTITPSGDYLAGEFSAWEFSGAESDLEVLHPMTGETHEDQTRSFQPVRHVQAADIQRAQPETRDELRHARLALRIVASEEHIHRPTLLQDMTEPGVEGLHDAGTGRGRIGDLLCDRGVIGDGEP